MAHALCMPNNKGKNSNTDTYLILTALPRQQWLHEAVSVLRQA